MKTKFKTSFKKINTYQDEKRSVSTFTVTVEGLFPEDLLKILTVKFNGVSLHYSQVNCHKLSFVVRGTASRNEEDQFDKFVGLDLSEFRAIKKGYSTSSKIIGTCYKFFRDIAEKYTDMSENISKRTDIINNRLNDLENRVK